MFPAGLAALGQVSAAFAHDSLFSMAVGSGLVVQLVLYLLVGLSVVSWGIILHKTRQIRRARRQSGLFVECFWESRDLTDIHARSEELHGSPVAQVFRAGYEELVRLTRKRRQKQTEDGGLTTELGGVANVERAMRRAVSHEITRLERSLTFLATTASTAPFIGLFGTVWGIMNAFRGLSAAHASSIQAVAPGISEALIATAAGLFAAIPAVVAYNHLARRIRVLGVDTENFCAEFLNIAERQFLG